MHVRLTPDPEPVLVDAVVDCRTDTKTWWRAEIIRHNPLTVHRLILEGGATAYQWLSGTGLHLRDIPDAAGLRLVTLAAPVRLGRRCCCLPGVPGQVRHSCRAAAAGLERPRRVGRPGRSVGRLRCPAALRRRSRRVVEHLYHLRSLGVDVPYLTPFFPSRSNHRYDASSFDRSEEHTSELQSRQYLVCRL